MEHTNGRRTTGKGIVVFTGCSHAGVVNTSRYASKLVNNNDDKDQSNVPIHAIVGGYHLATASDVKNIDETVSDLKTLDPAIMMAGHCTGWRAKFCIERAMPGSLVPCAVGMRYTF